MKKTLNIRSLVCLLLAAVVLLPVTALPAFAEEAPCRVALNLYLEDNTLMARYGLTVYLDSVCLGTLQQGGRMNKTLTLAPGQYTLYLTPGKSSVAPYQTTLYVDQDLTVTGSLQTHRKYIEMLSFSTRPLEIHPEDAAQRTSPILVEDNPQPAASQQSASDDGSEVMEYLFWTFMDYLLSE